MDTTENVRRREQAEINVGSDRATLEARYGQVWSTDEVRRDFDIEGFLAPYVVARRKSDQKRGSLKFQHDPRFYFGWREE